MIKLGIFITNINNSAGTERVIVSLANSFARRGINVSILSLASCKGSAFYKIDDNVDVIHMKGIDYEHKRFLSKVFFFIYNFFVYLFIKNDYDIILSTSLNTNAYALFKKKRGQKLILCEHFPYSKPISQIQKYIRNSLYRLADVLVVLTPGDAKRYVNKGVNAICIPNFSPFSPKYEYDSNSRTILAVGRHSTQKAFDRMIRIWKKGEFSKRGWVLKIVGDGVLLEHNKRLANTPNVDPSIVFINATKDIENVYRSASIYLMTSIFESLPMVLIEAKSFGLPIISFDCLTGPRELIEDGVTGYLIASDDVDQFISKLDLLVTDNEHRMEMSKNSYLDGARFGEDVIMEEWFNVLNLPYEKYSN